MHGHKVTEPKTIVLSTLEVYITNECNLTCSNCNRYNNYDFQGHHDWRSSESAVMAWSRRITAPIITIIGGEPLMHPELWGWVDLVCRAWPDQQIMIQSNGLVDRSDLDQKDQFPNLGIVASLHQLGMEKTIRKRIPIHKAEEIIDNSMFTACAIKDQGDHFVVHQSCRHQAFNACTMSQSHTLLEGRLYKCPMVAVLPKFMQQYTVAMTLAQQELLQAYAALDHWCADQDLKDFLLNEDKPIAQCALCPSDGVSSPVTFDPQRKKRSRREHAAC